MPIRDLVQSSDRIPVPHVRTEPIQERSAARVGALLDAAAAVVDEVGFDRLTTAMVAERAKASIGTVYRYFPDRIVLLHALRDRAKGRYRQSAAQRVETAKPADWQGALGEMLDAYVDMYENEPGFRIVRFVDHERDPLADASEAAEPDYFAQLCAESFVAEYGIEDDGLLAFRISVGIEISEALVARAYASRLEPDGRFIDEARSLMRSYLESFYA